MVNLKMRKELSFLLVILCVLCMLFACGNLCYRASAAEGEKLGVKDSVYGWEIASQKNLEFTQEGEWARFKETKKSVNADTIDVMFNREGYDIAHPIEFKIMMNGEVPTGDRWLGLFLCSNLTTHKMNIPAAGILTIDMSGKKASPWARCRIGGTVVGTTAGTGAFISGSESKSGVDADGAFTLRITVTNANTEVLFKGNEHELRYTIPEMTSANFANGKLFFNSRFHNNASAGLWDVSFSKVTNGLPVKYVEKGINTKEVRESIEAPSFKLAEAIEMQGGKKFAGWRAPDGKVYAAGAEYSPTETERAEGVTFMAVADASGATATLEYESVVYDGSAREPSVAVTFMGQTIPSEQYDLAYESNTMPGQASVRITFKGDYYAGTVTKPFTITKITENRTGEDLTFSYSQATYEKMTTETALGNEYTYTVKNAQDETVTVDMTLAVGIYNVTAVKETATTVTTVTYSVTVNKDNVVEQGTSFKIEFAEATYAKLTSETVLGGEYAYTVMNAQNETVTAETKLIAGVYTVTAVKETATSVTTVTYTVTVGKEYISQTGEDITFPYSQATYAKLTSETALGSEYTYTVKNAQDETITADMTLAVGIYNVTAVKETATTVTTVTYSVTVNKNKENITGTNLEFALAEATYAKMTSETVYGKDYVYAVKNSAGDTVTEPTELVSGMYRVTAVKETETTVTTVTYSVIVGKAYETVAGENLTFEYSQATYAKMTAETAYSEGYEYAVKDTQNETVTAEMALAIGVYSVTATKEEETKITVVSYTVTVTKDRIETTGNNFSLAITEATYAKMTSETALGSEYTYTVKNAAGDTVAADAALTLGDYNVTAVKETATSITTVTYTVTVEKEKVNNMGDNLTFTLAEATYEKMTSETVLGSEYTYTVKNAQDEIINADTELTAGTYSVTAVKETETMITIVTFTVTVTAEDKPVDEKPKSGCASAGIAASGVAGLALGIGLAFIVGLKKRKIQK